MGWVAKNDKKCWPPLPLGASASLTWNEDACALWAASHPPFEGGKVPTVGRPKLLGKPSEYRNGDTSRCVLLVQYNAYVYIVQRNRMCMS